MTRASALGASAFGLLLLAGCRSAQDPNVVLITLDTTRADRLGVMGDADARTPVLDALAARGVLFERAYASVPLTLPSHTTMLSGLEPPAHTVHDNGRFVVPPAIETVTERLATRGYATAAFVAAFVLDSSFGLNQGFERYDDDIEIAHEPLRFGVPSRSGKEITTRALAWLAESRTAPFFLWAHYYDVHLPRRPPPPFDAVPDAYAGALGYVDQEVGHLLAGVARAAGTHPTLIIVVGDHGESLGEHDEVTHGVVAYDSTLHVPLIVSGPGFPPGTRSARLTRTVDIAATILAAVGETPPASSPGRPLQDRLAPADDPEGVGYFECFGAAYGMGWSPIGGVRTARWKYTAEPKPVELYDVLADASETTNRAASEPEVVERLEALYAKFRAPAQAVNGPPAPSLDVQEKLAALGYVDVVQRFAPGERPDPRHFVGAVGLVDGARALALEGQVADSIAALEILATSPISRPLALRSLVPLYRQADRTVDAIRAAEGLDLVTGGLETRLQLAEMLLAGDRAQEALAKLESIRDGTESLPRVILLRGEALLQLGRSADAATAAATVLDREPANDDALSLASRARAAEEGAAAEIPRLREILRHTPDAARLVETREVLARLLRRERRDAEAVAVLESVPAPPLEHRAILAEIAREHGNPEKAVALYEAIVDERPAAQLHRRALADTYDILGRHQEALEQYDRLIAIAPRDATLYVDRGATRFRVRRLADAEADYRQAIRLDRTLPDAFLNLALVELLDGRDAAAERHLRKAVRLRPDDPKAHFHLARLYRRRSDPRAALHAEHAVGVSD